MADEKENKTERVHLLMTPSEVKAIDDWGFANRVRTRGAAIRRLVNYGIACDAMLDALLAATEAINELSASGTMTEETKTAYKKALDTASEALVKSSEILLEGMKERPQLFEQQE